MRLLLISALVAVALAQDCPSKKPTSKLICYYSQPTQEPSCKCTHVVLPANSTIASIERIRENAKGVKVLITVTEFNQGLVDLLNSTKVDGLEIKPSQLDSKNDISDFISTVRSKFGSDLYVILSVPSKAELLAKFYDFKTLSKNADLFILETAFLGASKNLTFHPSRLSGLWDMQNTDSVVDLVSGLGAPLAKLAISAPIQAFHFTLQSAAHTAPGSPALKVRSLSREELCAIMANGANWTLERDQDQTGPYIFSKDQWIAFEDATSIDIKAKYSRIRGLAGLALKDLSQDTTTCPEGSLLNSAFDGLTRQSRAPRGAVLHSLEREILETKSRPLDSIQVSPYRISRVIDVAGAVHVIRQDTRTEFQCSRQGYFVHPRSCGRFYRCVKFDQLSDEFSVFEFDCPAGLAFDERVEVCVWPGSLPHASPCSGSSEIAPVPKERFICPTEPGYYADPENCRWFFACLDHGKSPLSAYEFRCPFGLVYDESRLLCEWPWLVPKCGNGYAIGSEVVYGGSGVSTLDQYTGLGVLSATALGGVHGAFVPPVLSKVYSNVGTIQGQNYRSLQQQENLSGSANLQGLYSTSSGGLYQGNQYASTSSGLSHQAAQSLQNAGLLQTRVNLINSGLTTGHSVSQYSEDLAAHGEAYGSHQYHGSTQNSGIASLGRINQNYGQLLNQGAQSHQTINQYHGSTQDSGIASINGLASLNQNYGQILSNQGAQTVSQYHGSTQDSGIASINGLASLNQNYGQVLNNQGGHTISQYHGSTQNSGIASVNGLESLNKNYGEVLNNQEAQTISQYHGSTQNSGIASVNGLASLNRNYGQVLNNQGAQAINQYHGSTQDSGSVENVNNYHGQANGGAQSEQSFVQYHEGTGTSGNINIVGGGYSAVGVLRSGIEVSNNGADSNTISQVTASPIGVVSQVPTVVSVPIPSLKVASGFESYKGGVVANVPGLQYKLQNSGNTFYDASSRGKSSNSFLDYISSSGQTAKTISNNNQQGYVYSKPEIRFEETPIRTITKAIGGSFSYQKTDSVHNSYSKPVAVVQSVQPLNVVQGYNYEKPQVQVPSSVVLEQRPQVLVSSTPSPAVSSSFSITSQTEGGYQYPKPVVAFEEKPVVTYQQPQVYVSSTQTPIVQKVVQPAISSSFSINSQERYQYNKPVVAYQPQPQVYVSSTPTTIVQKVVQPAVSSSFIQEGYQYKKPVVAFEEKPIIYQQQPQVYVSSTPSPVVQEVVQPAISSFSINSQSQGGYQYNQQEQQQQVFVSSTPSPAVSSGFSITSQGEGGYQYPKPVVAFEEKPVVTYQQPQVYVSSTPAPIIQEVAQPAISSSFSINSQSQEGYQYNKPVVAFEEQPQVYVSSTPSPIAVQPAISSFSIKSQSEEGYVYSKPEERPVVTYQQPQIYVSSTPSPVSSSFSITNQKGYQYQKPVVAFEEKPIITYQQTPSVAPKITPVSTYNYKNVVQQAVGYSYPKPEVTYEQTPVTRIDYKAPVSTYSYSTPVVQKVAQPAVVSSYSYTAPSTTQRPAVVVKQPVAFQGYQYPKPTVSYVEEPKAIITYENRQPIVEEVVVAKKAYTTGGHSYQYNSGVNKPAPQQPILVSSTPSYEVKQQQYSVDSGYVYQKPTTQFEERPQKEVVVESYQAPQEPIVVSSTPRYEIKQQHVYQPQEPILVSSTPSYEVKQQQYSVDSGYLYQKPTIQFEERPQKEVVVESYQAPQEAIVVSSTPRYEIKQQHVYQPQQPILVSTTPSYEVKQQQYSVDSGYVYQKPTVQFEERPQKEVVVESYQAPQEPIVVSSTPRYEIRQQNVYQKPIVQFESYEAPQEPIVVSSTPSYGLKQEQYNVNSGYAYEERPQKEVVVENYQANIKQQYSEDSGYLYEKPKVRFEERPVVIKKKIVSTTPRYEEPQFIARKVPIIDYTYIQSTPKPTFASTIKSVILPVVTEKKYFYSTTPQVSLPVVTTSRPIARYSFSSLDDYNADGPVLVENYIAPPQVTTPAREYLPVRSKAPTREYLPVRTRVRVTTTQEPSREYLPVRVKSKVKLTTTEGTIVEVTTPSREYLPVRRIKPTTPARAYLPVEEEIVSTRRPVKVVKIIKPKTKTIVKVNDFHPLLSAKLGAQCTCTSNTIKLRKKPVRIIVEDDDDDDDNYEVENDNGVVVENYEYEPQRVLEVTSAPEEVSQKVKVVRVRPTTEASSTPSDREIAKAVRTGLQLVKQAAKEGTQEALAGKDFDRYGPGGVRGRNERLQGTVDCQRAGLFRHPTQCNKFYACRWDCTKNRFTLHVFNCPVHLTFDNNLGACNWPSQGPACLENTLLPNE